MDRMKVLIIDDEKLLVKSTCIALECYDLEAKGALNGEEGLKAAEEFKPDAILLDIMMPGMDGWQVLEKLKQNGKSKDIPVIVFTAKEYGNGKSLAESRGAVDFIPKPFELEDVVALLKQHINAGGEING